MDANHNFYAGLSEDCCNELEHVPVPVFASKATKLVTTSSSSVDKSVDVDAKEKLQNLATAASKILGTKSFLSFGPCCSGLIW